MRIVPRATAGSNNVNLRSAACWITQARPTGARRRMLVRPHAARLGRRLVRRRPPARRRACPNRRRQQAWQGPSGGVAPARPAPEGSRPRRNVIVGNTAHGGVGELLRLRVHGRRTRRARPDWPQLRRRTSGGIAYVLDAGYRLCCNLELVDLDRLLEARPCSCPVIEEHHLRTLSPTLAAAPLWSCVQNARAAALQGEDGAPREQATRRGRRLLSALQPRRLRA